MYSDSQLIRFYKGEAPDHAGRHIEDIWAFDHRRLEMVHDFIQWLFPLPDASRFNPDAPLLTLTDIAAFRSDPALQDRVRRSLDLMLDFLGLARRGSTITRGPHFGAAGQAWLQPANHNHLRVTRILLFLGHAGLDTEARALLTCVEHIAAHEGVAAIPSRTLEFWRAAVAPVR
jgi:hypothetical protein